ncbi:putative short-chain dehydrogenase/reductase family 42E member 2 [Tiliqua scincoides]|uniref:putative short-chain dehydrogenase/reductase family 42E member 2 n=1 Tax=Tiliqua scincoides TaxID=71010 RepID=UPI003462A211
MAVTSRILIVWNHCPDSGANVMDRNALLRACEGIDCLFHLASFGMSGVEALNKEKNESLNVGGTKMVIHACRERNIPWLIHCSSVNVVFCGEPIVDGNEETQSYLPPEKYLDHYSRTKSIGEQLVLVANGTPLAGRGILRTCAVRPVGIYGPEERKHVERLKNVIEKGLTNFMFGDPNAQMNWIHIENMIQALILAAEALAPEKGSISSGQAYFVHDGEKVRVNDWMSAIGQRFGCKEPWLRVPTFLVYVAAIGLGRAEKQSQSEGIALTLVAKVTTTETYDISKARRELGYRPQKFGFVDCIYSGIRKRLSEDAKLAQG